MNKYKMGDKLYYFSNGDVEELTVEIIEYDPICRQCKYNGQYEYKVRDSSQQLINDEIDRLTELLIGEL